MKKDGVLSDLPSPEHIEGAELVAVLTPEHKIYTYLLRKQPMVRPNQGSATDASSIRTAKSFVYLVAIADWFCRKVLVWRVLITLRPTSVLRSWRQSWRATESWRYASQSDHIASLHQRAAPREKCIFGRPPGSRAVAAGCSSMVSLLSQPPDGICLGNDLLSPFGLILATAKCIGDHCSERLFRTPPCHWVLRLQIMADPQGRLLQHSQDKHGRSRVHGSAPRKK